MKHLIKPHRLNRGDTIATVSISNGWSGDIDIKWKYELGVTRLNEIGLNVVAAPNSMKGSEYLERYPEARAEDIMWAFSNPDIKGIIANIGGNDSIKVIPYIDVDVLHNNPKIFIGYSDVMNLHLLCYKCGFSSFYGDNLLHPIAEAQGWHGYSKRWFEKVLFDPSVIGNVDPSTDWTFEAENYTNPKYTRNYYPNSGYEVILPYCANPIQKNQFILDENCEDPYVSWCISNKKNAVRSFRFDKESVERIWSEGHIGGEKEIEEFENGGTPWCITYTFMPDELKKILSRCGVKNISLAGPGAYARTIPNEVLVRIMNDPKQRSEFLDFCYKYDSNPYVCGMGKDNLLAKGELE